MANPIKFLQQKIARIITHWLTMDIEPQPQDLLYSFDHLSFHLKPCDILLVNGRSRVSEVIKIITQSRWSHAAVYIGRPKEITDSELKAKVQQYFNGPEDAQLVLESQMGSGVIVTPLEHYRHEELRVCRPSGINRKDADAVINYCIRHLGLKYDIRQILDLARFMFPWQYIPRQWRTSLFQHNAQDPTMASCSRLLADAFHAVRYPVLPEIIIDYSNQIEVVPRNARLFTPNDFDDSPFFEILKFPRFDLADQSLYQKLKWRNDMISNDRVGLRENRLFSQPEEDEDYD
jgi:hypothetical protein